MQDQKDDSAFDDGAYDDILDDSFEDDFADSDDDIALDEEDYDINDLEDDDFDPEWMDSPETDVDAVVAEMGAQKKKKFAIDMSFNAMVITGAIVLGVLVLVFQLATTKPTNVVERFVSALHMLGNSDGSVFGKEVTSTQIESAGTQGEEDIKGFLYEPETLNSMTTEMELDDAPPMPTPVTSEIQEIDTDKVSSVQVPRPPVSIPADMSVVTNMQENTEFLEQKLKKPAPKIVPEIIKPQIQVPINPAPLPEKISNPVVSNSPIQKQIVADTTVLEQKMTTIIDRLDDMELRISQIREADNSKIEDVSGTVKILKQEIKTLEKVSVVGTVKKTPQKSSKKISKPHVIKKVAKVSWELRAAQPGKAWISRKGQNDMQAVVVGDKLSGIGRVSSIAMMNGKWIVQGTNGQIRQ